MPPESRYAELDKYIQTGAYRIAREHLPESTRNRPLAIEELMDRIMAFVKDVRIIDREISLDSQESWKKLPEIQA